MKTELVKEKFETELKYSSYFLMSSILISFLFILFQVFVLKRNPLGFFTLLFLNMIVYVYFLFKCIQSLKIEKRLGFFSKVKIALNMLIIYYILFSLLSLNVGDFIIPKREIEVQEIFGDFSDTERNLLNDFIIFVKKKL